MMHRRKFVGALAGGLAILRSIAEAQPVAKVYRVGFLLGATGESVASLFHALQNGLRELGYVEGRNIVFVQRYGDGRMERLPDLAAELVRLKVDVIVTGTNLHVEAVRHATATDTHCDGLRRGSSGRRVYREPSPTRGECALTSDRAANEFLGAVHFRRVDQRHSERKASAYRFFFNS
jgi:hypothetical protein